MGASYAGLSCHRTASFAIKAFAGALEAESVDGTVSVAVIRRLCEALSREPGPLAPSFATAESNCAGQFAARQIDQQRRNYLGRLVVKEIAGDLLDEDAGLRRAHLPQLFHALTIILGEKDYRELQDRCAAVLAGLEGHPHRWDAFYADAEVQSLLQTVQVAVARAFKRFELRKEWFLTIMNSGPNSQSVGSNAFIVRKKPAESAEYFSEAHLMAVLGSLFRKYRNMEGEALRMFTLRWGVEPEKVFGPIFVELAKAGALR